MRLVLDTSVLVTALRSRNGAAAEVLRLILAGENTALLDLSLALEYREVLNRPEQLSASRLSREEMHFLLNQIEALSEPVEVVQTFRPLSNDPDDDLVLDLAINAQAESIITNNIRHLRAAAGRFGILVETPREFLIRFRGDGG